MVKIKCNIFHCQILFRNSLRTYVSLRHFRLGIFLPVNYHNGRTQIYRVIFYFFDDRTRTHASPYGENFLFALSRLDTHFATSE